MSTTGSSRSGAPGAPDEDEPLLEAIADSLGQTLITHSRVSSQISGDGIITAHQVELEASGGIRGSHLFYVEAGPRREERDGVLTFHDTASDDRVDVWAYPRDPALPALQAAVFPDGAEALLRRLGVPTSTAVTLKLESYRPGRRAVIRLDTGAATVFLKVLAPAAAGALARRHRTWLAAGMPVPRVLGWSDEGLLALSLLRGVPASSVIDRLDPARFVAQVADLQERIAGVPSTEPARTSLSARLSWYERRLSQASPAQAHRVGAIARRIERILCAGAPPSLVTVHGDLHIGQIFLDPSTNVVEGVLDIDTAGLGDPADDAAALYAHLVVTALINAEQPTMADRCLALAAQWRQHWRHHDDGCAFAERTAAIAATHLLAHALSHPLDEDVLLGRAEILLSNDDERTVMLP